MGGNYYEKEDEEDMGRGRDGEEIMLSGVIVAGHIMITIYNIIRNC